MKENVMTAEALHVSLSADCTATIRLKLTGKEATAIANAVISQELPKKHAFALLAAALLDRIETMPDGDEPWPDKIVWSK